MDEQSKQLVEMTASEFYERAKSLLEALEKTKTDLGADVFLDGIIELQEDWMQMGPPIEDLEEDKGVESLENLAELEEEEQEE